MLISSPVKLIEKPIEPARVGIGATSMLAKNTKLSEHPRAILRARPQYR
jgi:hypothetical protein